MNQNTAGAAGLLYQFVQRQAREDRDAVVQLDHAMTWRELGRLAREWAAAWSHYRGGRVGLSLPANGEGIAALAALDECQSRVTLFDASLTAEQTHGLARLFHLVWLLSYSSQSNGDLPTWQWTAVQDVPRSLDELKVVPGVTVLTSGTEGLPKAVDHTWESLFRPVRRVPSLERTRWLLAYRPHLYAGLQVLAQVVACAGCLVIPDLQATPTEVADLMVRGQITHASATPSYWRRLLLLGPSDRWPQVPLQQITIGGEAVDQALLDQLRQVFPLARLTHIYATTELGRCFAVSDGREGFPADYLRSGALGEVELRVEDNELYVRSPNRGRAANLDGDRDQELDTWLATGDLVEIDGDRVRFRGRRGEMINVGGNKVNPLRVEEVIRQVPGIQDVLVYGQSSSIAGHLVACQIVLHPDCDRETVRQAMLTYCQSQLQRYEVPRLVECVTAIALTAAGKRQRMAP